jgi:hypothetical protein
MYERNTVVFDIRAKKVFKSFNKISTSELTCVSYDPQNRGFELFAAVAGKIIGYCAVERV